MATALVAGVLASTPPALPDRPPRQVMHLYNNSVTTTGVLISTATTVPQVIITDGTTVIRNHHFTNPLIFTGTTAGTLLTTNAHYIAYDGVIPTGSTVYVAGNSWHGTAAMVTMTAWNMHEITALEYELLEHYPPLQALINELLHAGKMLTADYLAFIAEEEILTMPEAELMPFALRAMRRMEFAFSNLRNGAMQMVRKKIQADLHHPASMFVTGGGSYGYQPRGVDWEGFEIEHERDVGEDLVRGMLARQYFSLMMRWKRDVQVFRRARLWAATETGQAWIVADDQARRQEELARELRHQNMAELATRATTVQAMEAAVAVMQRKLDRQKRDKENFAKASIKKAVKLYDRLARPTSMLSMFVSNQEVTIASEASKLKFVIRSSGGAGWLFDRTQKGRSHTPYELMAFTLDDVFLMRLCVYFADTPVLDQLLAISVLVDAGDEERLLSKGNWFGHHATWSDDKTDYIAEHYPELVKRCPPSKVVRPPPIRENNTTNTPIQTNHTGIFTNYVDESQRSWEPFHGRVDQWIRTWLENMIATPEELTFH